MTGHVFKDPIDLARCIDQRYRSPAIIGIDGWFCAGKTSLGQNLANILGIKCFDLDSARIGGRRGYLKSIALDKIRENTIIQDEVILVSGACMLQIMEMANISIDGLIYVKRVSPTSDWRDEDELEGGPLTRLKGTPRKETFLREIRNYHKMWQPVSKADFEFHRID